MRKLEIIATSVEDAVQAQTGGASSLEVVKNLAVGGLTPPLALIQAVRDAVRIPLRIIIRPHASSFVYSEADVEQILIDIEALKRSGANGIVFGALHPDNTVNLTLTTQIARAAFPMEMTFHRAIDVCRNSPSALPALTGIIQRLLTSGLTDNVWDGRSIIGSWVEQYGSQFTIACGGGIRIEQLAEIVRTTHAPEYHLGSAAQTNLVVDRVKVAQILEIISTALNK